MSCTHLRDWTLSLEEDPSAEELGEDAAYRPHVHGRGVVLAPYQDLRGAVVLGHDLLGHVFAGVGLLNSGQTKVTHLQAEQKMSCLCFHQCYRIRVKVRVE